MNDIAMKQKAEYINPYEVPENILNLMRETRMALMKDIVNLDPGKKYNIEIVEKTNDFVNNKISIQVTSKPHE